MATVEQGPISSGLVTRVKSLLLAPAAEWDVINTEPATVKGLFTGYACILAAIPAIASVLGGLLFKMSLFGLLGPMFIVPILVSALLSYALSLVSVFVLSLVIDALAPSFDGVKDPVQATKTAVYAFTPAWVAGALNIIPPLGLLAALAGAVYSLFLLYLGLPKLMKAPPEKALGYTAVVIVIGIVIQWVALMVVGAIVAMVGLSALATGAATAAMVR